MLSNLMSWSLLIGFIVGFFAHRASLVIRCRYANKHHPLPNGDRHRVPPVNRYWIGCALAVCVVAWSVIQTEANTQRADKLTDDARQFAFEVQQCQREFNGVITAWFKVSKDNDRISLESRDVVAAWLHDIVFPPAEYASLPPSDPKRQAWAIGRTQAADGAYKRLRSQQTANDDWLRDHPLPEPTCGKGGP